MAADAMRLAKRLDEVGFSDIVQVRNKVMELRAAGQKVHAFHGGEPFFETPACGEICAAKRCGREQDPVCALFRHRTTAPGDRRAS